MKRLSIARLSMSMSSLPLALAGAWPGTVMAADDPLSFNATVVSDYRFRGISQTRNQPALQAGVDHAVPSGFYVGAWASTIRWIKDNGVKGPVELDVYGGYKAALTERVDYDLGLLQYAYLGNRLADTAGGGAYRNADTTELYAALTYGPVTAKLSVALTNLFGNYDFGDGQATRGSTYAEISGNFDLGAGFSVVPHVGRQQVRHLGLASYTDTSLTLNKDLGHGLTLGVALVGTDADKNFYVPGAAAQSSRFLGKTGGVLSLKATF